MRHTCAKMIGWFKMPEETLKLKVLTCLVDWILRLLLRLIWLLEVDLTTTIRTTTAIITRLLITRTIPIQKGWSTLFGVALPSDLKRARIRVLRMPFTRFRQTTAIEQSMCLTGIT